MKVVTAFMKLYECTKIFNHMAKILMCNQENKCMCYFIYQRLCYNQTIVFIFFFNRYIKLYHVTIRS